MCILLKKIGYLRFNNIEFRVGAQYPSPIFWNIEAWSSNFIVSGFGKPLRKIEIEQKIYDPEFKTEFDSSVLTNESEWENSI